jgi:hypothetical protein
LDQGKSIVAQLRNNRLPSTSIATYIFTYKPFDHSQRLADAQDMKAPGRPHLASLLAVMAALASGLQAQIDVTSVSYGSLTNGGNQTNQKITSANDLNAINYIDTENGNYVFSSSSSASVAIRRSSSTNNNTTAFYQYSTYTGSSTNGTAATVYSKGDKSPTLNELMLSNDLTQGIRNPFANLNNGAADATTSNIERIDFYFGGTQTITNVNDGLVFFDLENFGNSGDGFRIAVFTATGTVRVNGTNYSSSPTTYANTGLLVAPGSFGPAVTTPTGTDATYIRSSTASGDNLDVSQTIAQIDASSDGTLDANDLVLVGVMVRFSDLGLSLGDTILGYSLIASDTVVGAASDLVNWGNSSVYLTNTDANTSAGDMDFMGFGAQLSRYVPEPSTYGLLFGGGATALALWRRNRIKRIVSNDLNKSMPPVFS